MLSVQMENQQSLIDQLIDQFLGTDKSLKLTLIRFLVSIMHHHLYLGLVESLISMWLNAKTNTGTVYDLG